MRLHTPRKRDTISRLRVHFGLHFPVVMLMAYSESDHMISLPAPEALVLSLIHISEPTRPY